MKCPNCGSETSGSFCSECGAPLQGARCRDCNAALQPGSNFCTQCGAAVRERAAASGSITPWIVAGAALVLLIAVIILPSISRNRDKADNDGRVPISQMQGVPSVGGNDAQTTGTPNPGQLSGTPREQADRLFNRIMTAKENGDTTNAKFFLPMGIQAYEMVQDIDADGLYHLSLLQDFGGDYASARETAERILKSDPTHLLALAAAANASAHAGDKPAARKYAQQFLSAYDTEIKKSKEEYRDHEKIFPEMKKEMTELK